ncbi:carboxypeptidase regulatory-like domain-containing protein [Flavobacterium sp. DG2-3]|uniref:carboxypeptidase regulatory-like domain-containing protein n=1 Tax=Flavobacterium sp. DG2-3 TaxID=3068317 RepID=UPI00273F072A|nr:carboxypeptidase regulatory-like domain-containing protein [Flavobacterium sp. DG2-3]MDP5199131.1 carboxypeptidase regulatory-like domain-containing protein [Flavobacterium sp. DG2-3]
MNPKLIVPFLFTISSVIAQEGELKIADKNYDRYAYIDAIKIYENIANKGYKSADLFQKIGNSYYFRSQFQQAEKWYTALFEMNEKLEPEYYYRYAQTLKAVESYEKAAVIMEKFTQLATKDSRAKAYNKNKNYLEVIKKNSGRYEVKNAGINSPATDYGTAFLGNLLVFTSARDTLGFVRRKDNWTNQAFTNLYAAAMDSVGNLGAPKKFSSDINTKVNESTPAFTKDGQTMYFTRNNFLSRKPGKGKDHTVHLKIYRATLKNNKWANVEELPFNSDEYSTAHPALSPDDKTLYFTSDMPGTFGQSDIYKVAILSDGGFGPAENLGAPINTEGKETFPFISESNELYFASDGHPGLGGLDIFITPLEKNNAYEEVYNVGAPVNSGSDDFAFWINPKTQQGFFSTNRDASLGFDDIFKFKEKNAITYNHRQNVEGIVIDEETGKPLANMTIQLFDSQFNLLETVKTDQDGKYSFDVRRQDGYYVRTAQSAGQENQVLVSKVTGVITDPLTGKPVAGAIVQLFDSKHNVLQTVTSDKDGKYSFDVKAKEGYYVKTAASIREENQFLASQVTGIVTDENGKPLANVPVQLFDANSNVVQTVISDKDGKYTFNIKAKEGYSIRTEKENQVLVSKVTGIVTDENGKPLANAIVQLFDSKHNVMQTITSDADGKYSFDVKAKAGYYVTTATSKREENKFLTSKVTGIVTDENGKPLANVSVRLFDANSNVLQTIISDKEGKYTFDIKVKDGYSIRTEKENQVLVSKVTGFVTDENGKPLANAIVQLFDSKHNVLQTVISDKDGKYSLDVKAKAGYYVKTAASKRDQNQFLASQVTGIVTDENGKPLANTTIQLLDSKSNVLQTVTSDKDGNYSFDVKAKEGYFIRTEKENQMLVSKVTGIVTDENGKPLANAIVQLFDSKHNLLQTVTSDADGKYSFDVKAKAGYYVRTLASKKEAKLVLASQVTGIVTDENGKPLANATIQLLDSKSNVLQTVTSDKDGNYSFDVKGHEGYFVRVLQADGKEFETSEMRLLDLKNASKMQHNIKVNKRTKRVTTGDDLAKVFGIQNVLFSLNKYNIKPDTEQNLAKVIAVMEQYPNMKIDIRSYTDSRASEAYNNNLSEKRAQATFNYMVKKGISKNRLTAKGYGKSQLLNDCGDGVPCTEEQHQVNRRSEFIINMD